MAPETVLEVKHISKSFPGVKALDDVSFSVRKGSVHVLCGENGAGKSTLMKIINGMYQPDSGETLVRGQRVKIDFSHPSGGTRHIDDISRIKLYSRNVH